MRSRHYFAIAGVLALVIITLVAVFQWRNRPQPLDDSTRLTRVLETLRKECALPPVQVSVERESVVVLCATEAGMNSLTWQAGQISKPSPQSVAGATTLPEGLVNPQVIATYLSEHPEASITYRGFREGPKIYVKSGNATTEVDANLVPQR